MCCGGFPHYPPQCRGSPAPVTLYFTVTVFICLVLRSLRLAKMCAGFLTQEWVSIRYMSWAGWRGKMRLRCSAPSETTLLCFTAFDSSTGRHLKKRKKTTRKNGMVNPQCVLLLMKHPALIFVLKLSTQQAHMLEFEEEIYFYFYFLKWNTHFWI